MPNRFFGNHIPEFVHHSWLSLHPYLGNQGSANISRNISVLLMNIYLVLIENTDENMLEVIH